MHYLNSIGGRPSGPHVSVFLSLLWTLYIRLRDNYVFHVFMIMIVSDKGQLTIIIVNRPSYTAQLCWDLAHINNQGVEEKVFT